jgi:enoyl-CoA hydratase/carnithine racemase
VSAVVPVPPASLLVERRGDVIWWRLARADAANALSRGLVDELGAAVAAVAGDASARVVVVTGAGKAFCAGADLKERRGFTLDETRAFLDRLGAVLDGVTALHCPVVAAINGAAFGGGLELALACDLRLAAEGASMGLVETRLGIIPGAGGTQRLTRLVGAARAKEAIFTGRRFDAATARAWGLVSDVVPAAELDTVVERLAIEIAGAAPLAVAAAKAAIDGGEPLPIAEALVLERRCYETLLKTEDRNEGLTAFAEKRAPVFRGQ